MEELEVVQVEEVRETDVDVDLDEGEGEGERDIEESELLSEKERQNEEVNEKDNCSASSISSTNSTLEREERDNRLNRDLEAGTTLTVTNQHIMFLFHSLEILLFCLLQANCCSVRMILNL